MSFLLGTESFCLPRKTSSKHSTESTSSGNKNLINQFNEADDSVHIEEEILHEGTYS